jgi:iron-sulfur cluster assembly accessory protein
MFSIKLTQNAKNKINQLCADSENKTKFAVRLGVSGGGCAGFEYQWDMCDKEDVGVNDEIIDTGNGKLVITAISLMYLFNCEIDYVTETFQQQFVINNPNAESACGCGISITFDNEKAIDNAKILELN